MGNEGCCNQRAEYEFVDSQEEIYIREKIRYYSNKMCSSAELTKITEDCFTTLLLDIDGPPLDWVTEKSYNEFIYKIFRMTEMQNDINLIKLPYNNLNISIKEYANNFHLLLSIWLVGITTSKTMSSEEKITMIKNIILKCNNYVTFQTFSKFLQAFLEIMLIEVTFNFKIHNEKEINDLISGIYNFMNVNEYCKWLCAKMGKILTKDKKHLTEKSSIKNEYIKDDQLREFFDTNSFLFKPLELRNNFYNKYSMQGNKLPS